MGKEYVVHGPKLTLYRCNDERARLLEATLQAFEKDGDPAGLARIVGLLSGRAVTFNEVAIYAARAKMRGGEKPSMENMNKQEEARLQGLLARAADARNRRDFASEAMEELRLRFCLGDPLSENERMFLWPELVRDLLTSNEEFHLMVRGQRPERILEYGGGLVWLHLSNQELGVLMRSAVSVKKSEASDALQKYLEKARQVGHGVLVLVEP